MSGLMSIGAAVLKVVGLNPQRIGSSSESRVPAKPTFTGMDYQLTGLGEQRSRIEFATWPMVLGGLDALEILRQIHRSQAVVPFLRLQRNYAADLEGLVVVQHLDVDEERLSPFTGIGRVVHGEADLVHVAGASSFGSTTSVSLGLPGIFSGGFL